MNHAPASRLFQVQRLRPPRGFTPLCLPERVWLEIGAGVGQHALQFAQQHPNRHLVAIERTTTKFKLFAKRHLASHLPNVTPIHADAIAWTVYGLQPKHVAEVFLLYPNPELKNPAQRWLNMPFFEFLLSRLQDGGRVTLASNLPSYIDEAAMRCRTLWHLPFEQQAIAPDSARSHFERKYLARGEACRQLIITKPAAYVSRFDKVDLTLSIPNTVR